MQGASQNNKRPGARVSFAAFKQANIISMKSCAPRQLLLAQPRFDATASNSAPKRQQVWIRLHPVMVRGTAGWLYTLVVCI
jgi:hypothetical protein